LGKARKFGIAVLLFFFFIVILGAWTLFDDVEYRINDQDGIDITRTSGSCPPGSYEVDDGCLSCDPGYYLARDLMCYPESERSSCAPGSYSVGDRCLSCDPGYYLAKDLKCYPESQKSSGGNCGGFGTLFVTKPISIYTAAVVEVDGYVAGATDMSITVPAGSHHVKAWGTTTSGNQQSMSWNTYVDECEQTLIKWN